MSDLNSVILEGNLAADPKLLFNVNGTPICTFPIAVNREYKRGRSLEKEVGFFDVEAWSHLAEKCGDTLAKGGSVRICGRLRQNRWQDKANRTRTKVVITAEHVELKGGNQSVAEAG